MPEEIGTPSLPDDSDEYLETDDSHEVPTGLVTLYTEATPEKADRLLQEDFESEEPQTNHPRQWYAEHVLEHFQPDDLRAQGISRQQRVFTSPIPYQGMDPVRGRILLALDVDPETIFIADGVHITNMSSGLAGIRRIPPLLEAIGYAGESMIQEEFEQRFERTPAEKREELIEMSRRDAVNYWESVIPYEEYAARKEEYTEPEVLMLPETKISDIRKA